MKIIQTKFLLSCYFSKGISQRSKSEMSNHLPLYEYGSIRKATEKHTAKGRHKQRDEFLISSGILKSRSSETVFGDSLKSSADDWNDDKSECSSVSRLVSKLSVCTFIKTVQHSWAI